jgi:hypothetical protein
MTITANEGWLLRTTNDASDPPFLSTGRYASRQDALNKAYEIFTRPELCMTSVSLTGPGADPMNQADIAEWCNNRWLELHPAANDAH